MSMRAAFLVLGLAACAPVSGASDVLPRVERLDPRLDALVPPGATLERVAEGFGWAEGPLWNPATNELFFSDVERNHLHAWSEKDGTRTVVVDRYQRKRLNSPNDLVYSRAGDLYFTDPPFGLPKTYDDPAQELPFSGVYRSSSAGELTLLTSELEGPNGLAFTPDGRTLFVTADADLYRLRL